MKNYHLGLGNGKENGSYYLGFGARGCLPRGHGNTQDRILSKVVVARLTVEGYDVRGVVP